MIQLSIGSKHHKILQKEFPGISRQTIHSALRYFNNSETAKAIRLRAIELLEKEIEDAKQNEENVTQKFLQL